MKTYTFSLLSSLATTCLTITCSIPVQAASFDYNQLQLIKVRPLPFTNSLDFFGDPTNNEGYVAFFNASDDWVGQ